MAKDYPKFLWAVVPKKFVGCHDIRRYAYTHKEAIAQLKHVNKTWRKYGDCASKGIWTLFKLVQVNKRRANRRFRGMGWRPQNN